MACGARTDLDRGNGAPQPAPTCGDAVVDDGEDCDAGPSQVGDDCLDTCEFAFCGDGELRAGEACDDGNNVNGDGCDGDCAFPTCGNGTVDAGEDCDDPDPSLCTPSCTIPVCGDGFLAPGEACDEGPANGRRPALRVVYAGAQSLLAPIRPGVPVEDYYDLRSASAHTGLEEPFVSMLQPVLDPTALFLATIHNLDQDEDGIVTTDDGKVFQRFTGLPESATAFLADDRPEEFSQASDGSIIGDWGYDNNTDGGVIGPLPFPGEWVIRVDADFISGIEAFLVKHDGDPVTLPMEGEPVFLVAHVTPSSCTKECTIPTCGDGFVDGGEVCDDGDGGDPGGTCNALCSAFN